MISFLEDNIDIFVNTGNIVVLDSDIDILVEFKKTPDLLRFIELEEYLSASLQNSVDLVPKRKLKAEIRDQILKEAIAI